MEPREVSAEDKAFSKEWLKRIGAALDRPEVKRAHKTFKRNRRLLAGRNPDAEDQETLTQRVRTNLHFANMAAMLPQVYAKDPDFSCRPLPSVSPEQMDAAKKFALTAEIMVSRVLVKDCKVKVKAKKMLRSAYATSIGWWKLTWQEQVQTDPIVVARLQDTQDNIERVRQLRDELEDPELRQEQELILAQLADAIKGLEVQQEIVISRGLVLDFVKAEDLIVLDPSVATITDYCDASALAQRIWMTRAKFKAAFGYVPEKATRFSTMDASTAAQNRGLPSATTIAGPNDSTNDDGSLLCVYEVWDQEANRVHYVCAGEEGFCKESQSPDWTGKRWYPFFGGAFNEIDGSFYPLSDIELTEQLVDDYNQTREDFVRDREDALPYNVVREGGNLTDSDVKKLVNRKRGQTVTVKGIPGKPIRDDFEAVQQVQLNPANYDTSAIRADIEQTLGGGDAARGTVMKAKTATEAEIVSQGLRGRSAERQDIMEDVLNEAGPYALEVMLRKMTLQEVQAIAGMDASWPQLSIDQIFNLVAIEVRGGSTGKPDRLQEQDRWTKLLPVIKEAVTTVAELREKGNEPLAQSVIELTRETLRRFDERLDIDEFLPKQSKDPMDPENLQRENVQMKAQLQALTQQNKELKDEAQKGIYQVAAQIATSADPLTSGQAFAIALQALENQDAAGQQQPAALPSQEPQELDPTATAAGPTLQ
ncbi:hypothetical protein ACSFA2_03690 [Variovorax sp. LT2P21]|uniref:hypothetical protein n=1 Tax=Variovorax sp. LT2P21 TaxID=3443731 RepID=UPI003F481BA2